MDAEPPCQPPSSWWCSTQALKGTNTTTLFEKDVVGIDIAGKWVIITGSNNGIGFEVAKTLAKFGANLILACREPPTWETHPSEAANICLELAKSSGHASQIEWWFLDMADLSSVESFASKWISTQRPLDLLCNNAGMGGLLGERVQTRDGFEIIHQVCNLRLEFYVAYIVIKQVNLLSHVLLTLRLLESLSQSAAPRIVCTTSCHHFLGKYDIDHFNGDTGMKGESYANNKLYYQMWITEFQRRLLSHEKYKHITVNGVNPGYVNTGIWKTSKATLLNRFLQYLARNLAITPKQGSYGIVYVATSVEYGPNLAVQGVGSLEGKGGGHYVNRIWKATPMPYCLDARARLDVWAKISQELCLEAKGLEISYVS